MLQAYKYNNSFFDEYDKINYIDCVNIEPFTFYSNILCCIDPISRYESNEFIPTVIIDASKHYSNRALTKLQIKNQLQDLAIDTFPNSLLILNPSVSEYLIFGILTKYPNIIQETIENSIFIKSFNDSKIPLLPMFSVSTQ